MEKKIKALKEAYQSSNRDKIIRAARAVKAHDGKHPFAICTVVGGHDIVVLARKIVDAVA